MNKLMSIFGVILFAFALTLTSCDCGSEEACSSETEVAACADECAKACCLGCKATDGEAACNADHSCCVPAPETTEEVATEEVATEEVATEEVATEESHEGHSH